ncbi:MAG: hypothetical protein H5U21_01005 [Porphyrobacter sp.]|nr:hypothetical protein [Porphyrobacter sp.]
MDYEDALRQLVDHDQGMVLHCDASEPHRLDEAGRDELGTPLSIINLSERWIARCRDGDG